MDGRPYPFLRSRRVNTTPLVRRNGDIMMSDNSVWLITGSSSGLGRALAEKVLERGYRAVVTARKADAVRDLVEHYGDKATAVTLDVTKSEQITAAVKAAYDTFGQIDVLVNNAGYGYIGAIEEGED